LSITEDSERLPPIKYQKEFLHFFRRIDEYLKLDYSNLVSSDKTDLKFQYTSTIEASSSITAQAVSKSHKYLSLGFDDGMPDMTRAEQSMGYQAAHVLPDARSTHDGSQLS
jgi:hypothetical protein